MSYTNTINNNISYNESENIKDNKYQLLFE